jgi:hypothetical protein
MGAVFDGPNAVFLAESYNFIHGAERPRCFDILQLLSMT